MPRLNRRPVLLLPVLAVATTFALTACGNGGVAEESREHSVVTGAEGQVGDVRILDATITTGLLGTTTGTLSLTVYDQGQDADSLTAVSSPVAAAFQLPSADSSASASTDATGASSTTSAVTIPAMGVVALDELDAIDVTGLTGSPAVGDSLPVTFTFAGAGDITLDVPVVGTAVPATAGTPTPAVTGANVDNGGASPAVSSAGS